MSTSPVEYGTEAHQRAIVARVPAATYCWYPNVAEHPRLVDSLDPHIRIALYKGIRNALAAPGWQGMATPCFLSVPQTSVRVCGTREQLVAVLDALRGALPLEYLGADHAA